MSSINSISDFNKAVKAEINKKIKDKIGVLVDALKAATPVDTGNARDGWYSEGDSIRNGVEYVDRLNHGSSTQAPSHFIESTLLSVEGVKPSGTIVKLTRQNS